MKPEILEAVHTAINVIRKGVKQFSSGEFYLNSYWNVRWVCKSFVTSVNVYSACDCVLLKLLSIM